MNISPTTIYWITRLDGICMGIALIGTICICIGIGIIGYNLENRYYRGGIYGMIVAILGIMLLIANIFVPTTKEMAAIYIIPSVVNNEKVQKFAENSLDGLVNLSNEWVKEKLTDVKK